MSFATTAAMNSGPVQVFARAMRTVALLAQGVDALDDLLGFRAAAGLHLLDLVKRGQYTAAPNMSSQHAPTISAHLQVFATERDGFQAIPVRVAWPDGFFNVSAVVLPEDGLERSICAWTLKSSSSEDLHGTVAFLEAGDLQHAFFLTITRRTEAHHRPDWAPCIRDAVHALAQDAK